MVVKQTNIQTSHAPNVNRDNSIIALADQKFSSDNSGHEEQREGSFITSEFYTNGSVHSDPFKEKENYNQQNMRRQGLLQRAGEQQMSSIMETAQFQPVQNSMVMKPPQVPKQHTNLAAQQQVEKKKDLMVRYTEIPIKELNSTEGFNNAIDDDQDDQVDEYALSMEQRLVHTKWQVRRNAYKAISDKFVSYYVQQNAKSRDEVAEQEDEEENPFESYSPWLEKMICDSNLIAQFEGLECLAAYIKCASDVRQVVHSIRSILLDKVQLNKANFRDKTIKIVLAIMKRQSNCEILPDLYKRIKGKNMKTAQFCLQVIIAAIVNENMLSDLQVKTLLPTLSVCLENKNRDFRSTALDLFREIYIRVDDEDTILLKQLSGLRPIQVKEIKDMIATCQKQSSLITIFSEKQVQHAGPSSVKQVDESLIPSPSKPIGDDVDLNTYLPDNFNEIPYVSQITVKKQTLEQFNKDLERVFKAKASVNQTKDYTTVINVVVHMLEDSNALVFMEAIKTVEILVQIIGKTIKAKKMKQFVSLLSDKYKESKSQVISAVNKGLQTCFMNGSISKMAFLEYLVVHIVITNKNPRIKHMVLEKVNNLVQTFSSEEDLESMFKIHKQHLVSLVQKDNNANVRDASVDLFATYKRLLATSTLVAETINGLKGYRVAEINKKALEGGEIKTLRTQESLPEETKTEVKQKVVSQTDDFSYGGRQVSFQHQVNLADLIMAIKKTVPNQISQDSLIEKYSSAIDNLGENGIKETKPIIVSCTLWAIQRMTQVDSNLVDILLAETKKIFCIERSMTDTGEMQSALLLGLRGAPHTSSSKISDAYFNVIHSAFARTQVFFEVLEDIIDQVDSSSSFKIMVTWLISKLEFFMAKGVSLDQLESTAEVIPYSDALLKQIAQKRATQEPRTVDHSAIEHHDDLQEEDDIEEMSGMIGQISHETLGERICSKIDEDFSEGLMMIKNLESEDDVAFETKKEVVQKLLSILAPPIKSMADREKQIYSLKALHWLRQELLSLEDIFQLSDLLIEKYAKLKDEGSDASCELDLLNQWTLELSLRDLCDRIACASSRFPDYFLSMFAWLTNFKVTSDSEYQLEDLRKIVTSIAANLPTADHGNEVSDFFDTATAKFGQEKTKETFEIMLMNSQVHYRRFVQWFSIKYPVVTNLAAPNTNQLQKHSPRAGNDESEANSYHSKLYHEMRAQRKQKQEVATVDDSLSGRYQDILNKLEQHIKGPSPQKETQKETKTDFQQLKNQMEQKIEYSNVDVKNIDLSDDDIQEDHQNNQEEEKQGQFGFYRTTESSFAKNISASNRYEEADDEQSKVALDEDEEVKQSVNSYHKLQSQVEIDKLREEKDALEFEKMRSDQAKQQEADEWKQRVEQMKRQHEEVMASLKKVSIDYKEKQEENQDLKTNLKVLSNDHSVLKVKFEEMERQVALKQQEPVETQHVVKQQQLQIVEKMFEGSIAMTFGDQMSHDAIRKIQELLLYGNAAKQEKDLQSEIFEPLVIYFAKTKNFDERLGMIKAINSSVADDDILFAIPIDVYKVLLNFLLTAFAKEKQHIENTSIRASTQSSRVQDQNEITTEIQKIVSRLLNSKEFTTSLVVLLQIIQIGLPSDFRIQLSTEQQQYLKVVMRCSLRITKALHTESDDLIRAFDVLIEMYRLFISHPPEKLTSDLPCLSDFDYVYRGLKDIADKFIEIQPRKVRAFLNFIEGKQTNAFIVYMGQMVCAKEKQMEDNKDDDDEY